MFVASILRLIYSYVRLVHCVVVDATNYKILNSNFVRTQTISLVNTVVFIYHYYYYMYYLRSTRYRFRLQTKTFSKVGNSFCESNFCESNFCAITARNRMNTNDHHQYQPPDRPPGYQGEASRNTSAVDTHRLHLNS